MSGTRRNWLAIAAANGLIAVAAGAFAAHGLKPRLAPDMLEVFKTGAQYQIYHALALLLTATLIEIRCRPGLRAAAWCFLIGIILFSGSLYALALTSVKPLGAITPFGGVAFLLGWLLLFRAGLSRSPAQ